MQVTPYTIYEASDGKRVLVVDFHKSKSFRFYTGKKLVKFQRVAGQLIATISEAVKVYKLPRVKDFDYVYMSETRQRYNLCNVRYRRNKNVNNIAPLDTEVILYNMLEYIEQI